MGQGAQLRGYRVPGEAEPLSGYTTRRQQGSERSGLTYHRGVIAEPTAFAGMGNPCRLPSEYKREFTSFPNRMNDFGTANGRSVIGPFWP